MKPLFLSVLLVGLLAACGHEEPGEIHGDILLGPSGLTLTQEDHAPGWGRSDCYSCHLPKNIHRIDQSDTVTLDLDAITAIVERDGLASCATCHGPNGL